jgi:hypothetical protein
LYIIPDLPKKVKDFFYYFIVLEKMIISIENVKKCKIFEEMKKLLKYA